MYQYEFFPNFQGCATWGIVGLCSGHGTCVDSNTHEIITLPFQPNSECICHESWTAHGHFISQWGQDCSTHIPTILAFVSFCALVEIICLMIQFRKLNAMLHERKVTNTISTGFYVVGLGILFHTFKLAEYVGIFGNQYPGDNPGITLLNVGNFAFANICQMYYRNLIIPLSISLIELSKDDNFKIKEAQKARFCAFCHVIYLPILICHLGVLWGLGWTTNMMIKHIFIFLNGFLPLLPVMFAGYNFYFSVKTVSNILVNDMFIKNNYSNLNFAQQMKRYDASKRLNELSRSMKFAYSLRIITSGLIMFWPFFRTRLIYINHLLTCLISLSNVQQSLSLSNSGKNFSSDDSLELFMFLVNEPKFYDLFYKFLKSEFSAENLLFWQRIEQYRTCDFSIQAQFGETDTPTLLTAKNIYLDFIDASSAQTINISSERKQNLTNWYNDVTKPASSNEFLNATKPEILKTLYIDAQREVFDLMRSDSLVRFQQTSDYKHIQKAGGGASHILGVGAQSDSKGQNDSKGGDSKGGSEGSSLLKGNDIIGSSRRDSPYRSSRQGQDSPYGTSIIINKDSPRPTTTQQNENSMLGGRDSPRPTNGSMISSRDSPRPYGDTLLLPDSPQYGSSSPRESTIQSIEMVENGNVGLNHS